MTDINLFLFDDFETLDLFGPVEILGKVETFNLKYFSINGGIITSKQGTQIITHKITESNSTGILLMPGGQGTRRLVDDSIFIDTLSSFAKKAEFCLGICTGSVLLAKTGLLNNREATSNKKAFDWAVQMAPDVCWKRKARWVVDGKFYTSSGVSAGIDMALAFVADRFGQEKAQQIATHIEYVWNSDKENDIFS
ncbi:MULTISPECIES: DJ-1/PfpI family protein [Capnocytophaga]|uniref:DJ-1/PfpI family protein n=1 Tax=Capnocytophaga TaxID=1016 RepID=UPI0037D91BE0